MTKQELNNVIDDIINRNIELIGDEGMNISIVELREEFINLIKSLSYTDLTKIREMI